MAKDGLDRILMGLEQYLATEKLMGRTHIELDHAVLEAVREPSESKGVAQTSSPEECVKEPSVALRENKRATEPSDLSVHFDVKGNQVEPPLLIILHTLDKSALELLEKMVKAMGFDLQEIGVLSLHKPSETISTHPSERNTLTYAMLEQIRAINPRAVIGMGAHMVEMALGQSIALTQYRGKWAQCAGYRLMPTYGLNQVLQDETLKRPVWNDLQLVMHFLKKIES
jgi:uracil-DNA glycosylase family 4